MSGRDEELLRVEGLSKFFPVVEGLFGRKVGDVRAVDDVSFSIGRGETLGLIGESGCGKTTAGRSILRLIEPSAGRIWFDGTNIAELSQRALRPYRRRMQIVFQDPFGALNPRLRVVDLIGEAIEQHGLASGAGISGYDADMLLNPEINVHLGTRFLASQMRRWNEQLPLVFIAYNAGPARAERWRSFPEFRDRELFTERIPFEETRDYVKILTRNMAIYRGLYGR